jgi:hypothetical protein
VQANEPSESIGELIGGGAIDILFTLLEQSPAMRARIITAFAQAADCRDLRAWLVYLLREVLGIIYGRDILQGLH